MNCFSFAARYLKTQVEGVGAVVKVQLDFSSLIAEVHCDNAFFQAFERSFVYNNAFILIKMNHRSPDFRPKVIWHYKVPYVILNLFQDLSFIESALLLIEKKNNSHVRIFQKPDCFYYINAL